MHQQAQRLAGKTIIVTGGAQGIGAAVAAQIVAQGARAVVADIDEAGARKVCERLTRDAGLAEPALLDVRDEAAFAALAAGVLARHGRIDGLVNNAGINVKYEPLAMPSGEWDRCHDVNLKGAWNGCRAVLPAMIAQRAGSIVNMASILGTVGFANSSAYSAAKHGLLGLTQTAALEYSAKGIRTNAVGPAFIDTPLLAALPPGAKEALVAVHPIGRLGTADEVAQLVVFLLSDKASFISGSYHLVDGGYTAQ